MTSLPFSLGTASGRLLDLIFLILVIVVPMLVRWMQQHRAALAKWYMANTTTEERTILADLAKSAVSWVERYASSPAGQDKFKQAVNLVQGWLVKRGIHVDLAEVEGVIQQVYAELKATGVLAAAGPTIVAPTQTKA